MELSDAEVGTRVRLLQVAVGPGAAESTAGHQHGWRDLLTRLAALLERDESHGIAGSNGPVG